MCHWKEMYWEMYLSDQTNTQTVISLNRVFVQTGIDITWWNNDQKVKLVKQLMTGIDNVYENDIILLFTRLIKSFKWARSSHVDGQYIQRCDF